MRITRYTDYTLRVLIYLAADHGRQTTIAEIADAFSISKSHLMKVVHQLNLLGYIKTTRGKNGGLSLERSPADINLGVLFRQTETDLGLVECFGEGNECRITPVCRLKNILADAQQAFIETLDQYSLADLVYSGHKPQLLRLLDIA
ncbi:MAG: Rrf2 family transcriptional regulator [Saccharospirillum sp.]|nr:Rrf2 family transcriptional regulator [Saccharospirillum sp.]